jgi:hypothetical protein
MGRAEGEVPDAVGMFLQRGSKLARDFLQFGRVFTGRGPSAQFADLIVKSPKGHRGQGKVRVLDSQGCWEVAIHAHLHH